MKNLLIIIIFLTAGNCVAQISADSINCLQSKTVIGFIDAGKEKFIVLEDEIIKIKNDDFYTQYYRTIYGDSTIVNPNTLLNNKQSNIEFLSTVDLENYKKQYYTLPKGVKLKTFFNIDSTGKFFVLPQIDSLFSKYKKK